MLYSVTLVLCFTALIFAGLMAGLFFAYSISVMWGLDAIAGNAAVAAMRSINLKIQNPVFLTAFMLTPVTALLAGILLLLLGHGLAAVLMFAGAAAYVFGAFIPTVLVNVPMNEALEAVAQTTEAEAANLWSRYSARWTWWNHVRTLGCVASLGLVGAALFVGHPRPPAGV